MKIKEYIESGVLEAYVLGSASEAEVRELLYLKGKHPEIKQALQELELDMERIAEQMAISPPPLCWTKIEAEIDAVIPAPEAETILFKQDVQENKQKQRSTGQYIEVEVESTYMRVHKSWKWIFITVFILSKIFLISAIYFYLENKHAQEEVRDLKTELQARPAQSRN